MAADVKPTASSNNAKSISVEGLLPSVDTTRTDGSRPEMLTSSIIASASSVILAALLSPPLKSTTPDRTAETTPCSGT